jgi:hypothetical protein
MGGTMKRRAQWIAAISMLLFLGCGEEILDNTQTVGETRLTIDLDLLPFLDVSQSLIPYGRDPVIPGIPGSFQLQTPAQTIDLRSDLEGVGSIESLEMFITLAFRNESGTADLTYRAFLAGLDENPLETAPIISETVNLNGPQNTTSEFVVSGDERLIALFQEGLMQYMVQVLFRISEGSDNISGEVEVVRFDVKIVATL